MKDLMMTFAMLMAAAGLKAQVAESGVIYITNIRNRYIPAAYAFDGKAHIVTVEDNDEGTYTVNVYDDNFKVTKSFTTIFGATTPKYYFNYDTETSYGDLHVSVTQTLFNDDENYEYLVEEFLNVDERKVGSFKIVSDDGKVLQTITPADGMEFYEYTPTFLTINGKGFLKVTMHNINDGCLYDYFYAKDPNVNGVKQVGAPVKTRVSPSVVGRNENLTVELSNNESRNSLVTVHDASGRSVYRAIVPSGQKTLQINSASLNQGLNVVSVTDGKRNGESSKVIVK